MAGSQFSNLHSLQEPDGPNGAVPKQFPFVNVSKEFFEHQHAVNQTNVPIKICNDADVNAIASKYPEVFCGRVTMMKGKPATIELSNDATPTSTGYYRTIADAYLAPLKKELDTQVAAGILEKMGEKPDAAKYWLHPIVVVPKKGTTDVRLCVDFRKLNKFCLRPTNPQKTLWRRSGHYQKGRDTLQFVMLSKGITRSHLMRKARQ